MGRLTFPRWSEAEVKQYLSGHIGRAIDGARRTGDEFVWPLPAKAGEIQNQAVRAYPDGSWTLEEYRPIR